MLCCAVLCESCLAVRRRPGAGGEMNRDAFVKSMKTVEVTFQNLDSSEISLTGGANILFPLRVLVALGSLT